MNVTGIGQPFFVCSAACHSCWMPPGAVAGLGSCRVASFLSGKTLNATKTPDTWHAYRKATPAGCLRADCSSQREFGVSWATDLSRLAGKPVTSCRGDQGCCSITLGRDAVSRRVYVLRPRHRIGPFASFRLMAAQYPIGSGGSYRTSTEALTRRRPRAGNASTSLMLG